MKNTPEQQFLWELIKYHYGTGNIDRLQILAGKCSPDLLKRLTLLTGLEGFFYSIGSSETVQEVLPPGFLDFLRQRRGIIAIQNDLVLQNALVIVKMLNEHHIDYILLKGFATLERLYDDPAMRVVSDLDIVIKREDYPKVRAFLLEDGFYYSPEILEKFQLKLTRQEYETFFHEISYFKDTVPFPTALDLHFNFSGFSEKSLMRSIYPIDGHDWFGGIQILKLNGYEIQCLDLEMSLLYMVYHCSRHSFRGLKWLVDICQLIVKYNDQIDWCRVYRTAAHPNLRKLVGICLTMVSELTDIERFGEYCLNDFNKITVDTTMYQNMSFADIHKMKARIGGKMIRLGLPVSWSDKMKILGYTLFDRDSIIHRTGTKTRSGIDPLQPFRWLGLIIKDTIKENRQL
jgi:hypothetical protein